MESNLKVTSKLGFGVLTIALLLSLGLNIQPDDTHYCKARNITYHCDILSKYYGLENGKCINDLLPNKLCRSGWEEIFGENIQKQSKGKWICDPVVCRQ